METALVFRPRAVLQMTCIVSESHTMMEGFDPIEPVTTLFLLGQTPKETMLSVWPFAYLLTPVPKNRCLRFETFMTIPKAAAG